MCQIRRLVAGVPHRQVELLDLHLLYFSVDLGCHLRSADHRIHQSQNIVVVLRLLRTPEDHQLHICVILLQPAGNLDTAMISSNFIIFQHLALVVNEAESTYQSRPLAHRVGMSHIQNERVDGDLKARGDYNWPFQT